MSANLSLPGFGRSIVAEAARGGDPDGLRPYQRQAVTLIHEQLRDHRSTLLVMATGLGKCLGRGTPVMRSDGTIAAVEDVAEGDDLMGHDGRPRRVLGVNRAAGALCRVVPVKGEPWICNDVHVLTLVHTSTGAIVDVPLDRWQTETKSFRHCHKLLRVAVEFPDRRRPERTIDPYFLGVLLGDGCLTQGTAVCKGDPEIRDVCASEAQRWGLVLRIQQSADRATVYHLVRAVGTQQGNPLTDALRALGVHGRSAGEKCIPSAYKTASRVDRLALLAGMIDTDGSLANDGCCFDWISASRALADDFVYVARSLGFAAYVSLCRKTCQTGATGTYFRVCVSGDTSLIPTRIPRKRAAQRAQKKSVLRTGFRVERLGDGEYFGFTLDGDGRFLLGDFTVTHNTQTFGAVAKHWPGRVLVLAHLDTLIQQAHRRMEAMTGELCDVESGELRAGGSRIVIASVQSLHRKRLTRWARDAFGLLIVDEAHHVKAAGTYQKIIRHFDAAKLLGVTATPDRADGKALDVEFESVAFRRDIDDGINDGFLCPVKIARIHVDSVNLAAVRTTAGDLNQGDLDAIMSAEANLHAVARGTLEQAGDRKTIVFSGPTVATAQRLVEVFNRYRPGCAHEVNGGTDPLARRRCYKEFEGGTFQFLINVGVLTEGFDSPRVSCISLARMTKSRALYTQMAGRGLRIADDKIDCLLIDFVGNSGRHSLISALDILGGTHDEDVKKKAKKLLEKRSMSAADAMAAASAEIAADAKRAADKRAAVQARVKYRVESVNPFAALGIEDHPTVSGGTRMATNHQADILAQNGFSAPVEGWSHEQAERLVGEISRRKQQGLASPKQINSLRKQGIDARRFSRSHAGAMMGALVANKADGYGWKFRPGEVATINARWSAPREPGSEG